MFSFKNAITRLDELQTDIIGLLVADAATRVKSG